MEIWYNFAKGIVRTYLTFFVEGFDVQGKENLEPGPKIIVANHPNATDAFFLPFIFPEKMHFLIEEKTFNITIIGRLLKLADQIPVIVGRGREALGEACEKLSQGHSVVIFPEGHLNHGKALRRAGAGAAMLALKSGAPLVPVGFYVPPEFTRTIRLSNNDRDIVGRWQMRGRCFIQIGEPWILDLVSYRDQSYRSMRELTDGIMLKIQNLVQLAENTVQASTASRL
jgi:1-acyl-sn-glycerol-3-phosphate acyltransferase